MTKNGGYPAFPITAGQSVFAHGMSIRDWFAGQALVGWMASFDPDDAVKASDCAELAYELADAMLAERDK